MQNQQNSDFSSRLIQEESELKQKRQKLIEFMGTDTHDQLDFEHRDLLQEQAMLMLKYQKVLNKRLELISKSQKS